MKKLKKLLIIAVAVIIGLAIIGVLTEDETTDTTGKSDSSDVSENSSVAESSDKASSKEESSEEESSEEESSEEESSEVTEESSEVIEESSEVTEESSEITEESSEVTEESSEVVEESSEVIEESSEVIEESSEIIEESSESPETVIPNDIVVPAIDYEKDVVSLYGEQDFGNHVFRLPKINGNTENIKAFNDKIYNTYSNGYNLLINNQEDAWLINVYYEYKVQDNLVIITIYNNYGEQLSEWYQEIDIYYYDLEADMELTHA